MQAIYGLVDPRTGTMRYVGLTTQTPTLRYKAHRKTARLGGRTLRDEWLRELFAEGLEANVVLLQRNDAWSDADLYAAERQAIAEWRERAGEALLNQQRGGEWAMSVMRERMRDAHTRRDKVPMREAGKRLSAGNIGRRHTAEAIAAMTDAQRDAYARRQQAVTDAVRAALPDGVFTRTDLRRALGLPLEGRNKRFIRAVHQLVDNDEVRIVAPHTRSHETMYTRAVA